MSRHIARLARLERVALVKTPRRMFVVYEGDPEPENLGQRDVVLLITYTTPAAEVEPPKGAGVTIILPDNGRGDGPPKGRRL